MKKSVAARLKVIDGARCEAPRSRKSRPEGTMTEQQELDRLVLIASQKGETEKVALLLDKGADANAKNEHGWTALHKAVWNGHRQTAELLINNGADVDTKDCGGMTLLMAAAKRDDMELLELLVVKGADVNAKDCGGMTVLVDVCIEGKEDAAEFLIANGADVNAKDDSGRSVLEWASDWKQRRIVRLLKKHGAKE